MERILIAIITTGAHLFPKKWAWSFLKLFFSCSQTFIRVFQANEEKEKFAEEQKRICQTMGWRDYNQGNLSGFDGYFRPVEVKRQIIQEQEEKKEEKDKVKARKKRLVEIGAVSLKCAHERFHEA